MERKPKRIGSQNAVGLETEYLKVLAYIPTDLSETGRPMLTVHCNLCGLKSDIIVKNFWIRKGCGCARQNLKDVAAATDAERGALNAMTERWLTDNATVVPEHLKPFWKPRLLEPDWHPDNPDRYHNFIRDVGHKRLPNQKGGAVVYYGLLDPAGDFTKENFYWKHDAKGHQGTNRKPSRKRKGGKEESSGASPPEVGESPEEQEGVQ